MTIVIYHISGMLLKEDLHHPVVKDYICPEQDVLDMHTTSVSCLLYSSITVIRSTQLWSHRGETV